MFNSLYFRSYEDSETNDGQKRVYFGNPLNYSNIKKGDMINFDKLDSNGIVKEGSYVTR